MINQVVLIGRIKLLPVNQPEDDLHDADMVLQVMRPFAESDGSYSCDEVLISMWCGQAATMLAHCAVGDLIGLKGRIKQDDPHYLCKVIAEKITVLQPGSLPLMKEKKS